MCSWIALVDRCFCSSSFLGRSGVVGPGSFNKVSFGAPFIVWAFVHDDPHANTSSYSIWNRQIRGVYYCAPAFHTLLELNSHYGRQLIAQYSRFVKPSELPAIADEDEHWLRFREARGGPVAFFSDEGKRIEVDERAILNRLHEDLERTE
jgi:hypothetical protein